MSLEPLAHCRNVANFILVDVHLNWRNFCFLVGGLLVILIDCMIFVPPLQDVTRMPMLTVSFLTQLGSGIFCL